jgi:rhodanese-related sulfurtransferase
VATRITLPELQELLTGDVQLVEVLPESEYAEAHLPGAVNLPLKRLTAEAAGTLSRHRAVVVYCWDSL